MSATRKLRDYLEIHNIKWFPTVWSKGNETCFKINDIKFFAYEDGDDNTIKISTYLDLEKMKEIFEPDMDKLFPYGENFVRADIYRSTMKEYNEWMEKAESLMKEMWECLTNPVGFCAKKCEYKKECDLKSLYDCVWESKTREKLKEFNIGNEDE